MKFKTLLISIVLAFGFSASVNANSLGAKKLAEQDTIAAHCYQYVDASGRVVEICF